MRIQRMVIHALVFLITSAFSFTAFPCTGIQLKTKDGSFVNGRTVEFGIPLNVSGLIVPRNYAFKGTLPNGGTGLIYKSKYAAVGGNMFGEPAISDGLNEKGLSIGAFYFPGYAGYATITPENKDHALSPTEFANWIITQFATTDEVKQGIKSVVIAPTTPKGWPVLPPLHYVVYDQSGKSIVIEPVNGQFVVYDNPIGVMTNSPTFAWHLTNLANYINLSPDNAKPVDLDGLKLTSFGQGSGLRGMPGDFTSPSRFVRAAIFSVTAIPAVNADQGVLQAFHILNQFDIPVGAVREVTQNKMYPEYTMTTTVKDPQNKRYYFRTFQDQTIRKIDMNEIDMNAAALKTVNMNGTQIIVDATNTAS